MTDPQEKEPLKSSATETNGSAIKHPPDVAADRSSDGSVSHLPDAGVIHSPGGRQSPGGSTYSCGDEPYGPPVPPDGGYGWIILCASFVVNFLVDGVCFSFGIFFLEFLDHYDEGKETTSWVGSVLNGMYLTMGELNKIWLGLTHTTTRGRRRHRGWDPYSTECT